MIRTFDRTPRYYNIESRDFQLLGDLYDAAFNTSKAAIDTMLNNQGTNNLDTRFLQLMCYTLGFTYQGDYTSNELLYVVKTFKNLLANKGSKKAIEDAIKLLIGSQSIKKQAYIEWKDNTKEVDIYVPTETKNITLLEEIFNYILPAGWLYDIILQDVVKGSQFDVVTAVDNRFRFIEQNNGDGIENKLAVMNYLDTTNTPNFKDLTYIGQVPKDGDNINKEVVGPLVSMGTVTKPKQEVENNE